MFSPCFGGPFLPQPPAVYARLLSEKLVEHGAGGVAREHGWTGGPAGQGATGCRSRRLGRCSHAALSGELEGAEMRIDPVFGFEVPVAVPGVDTGLLDPAVDLGGPGRLRREGRRARAMFRENFEQFAGVDPEVAAAGPAE